MHRISKPEVIESFVSEAQRAEIDDHILQLVGLAGVRKYNYRHILTFTENGGQLAIRAGRESMETSRFDSLPPSILSLHRVFNELLRSRELPVSDVVELFASDMPTALHQDDSARGFTGLYYPTGCEGFEIHEPEGDITPVEVPKGGLLLIPARVWHEMTNTSARTLVSMSAYDPTC